MVRTTSRSGSARTESEKGRDRGWRRRNGQVVLMACLHINAVIVLPLTEDEILAWLCPSCETPLPADFGDVRPCCRTPHGLMHLDTCPHFAEWMLVMGYWTSRSPSGYQMRGWRDD
jgi:hypothetical protein